MAEFTEGRMVIRGTREEKIQQILDSAPGMARKTAEQVVDEHTALGYDEIVQEGFYLQAPNAGLEDPYPYSSVEQVAELFRQAEEALGGRVIRDGNDA